MCVCVCVCVYVCVYKRVCLSVAIPGHCSILRILHTAHYIHTVVYTVWLDIFEEQKFRI